MALKYPILIAFIAATSLVLGCCGPPGGGSTQVNLTVTAQPTSTAMAEPTVQTTPTPSYRPVDLQAIGNVLSVAISNGGTDAVAGTDAGVLHYQDLAETPAHTYGTDERITGVDISRDGKAYVAGGYDGIIYYFKNDSETPAWTYDVGIEDGVGNRYVEGVSISDDGAWVAAVSDSRVYVFNGTDGTPVLNFEPGQEGQLRTVAISGDGSRLVVGTMSNGNGYDICYLDRQKLIWSATLPDLGWGAHDMAAPVAISYDGRVIAAGGKDNSVNIWSGTSSTPAWTYKIADECPVYSISVSDDGQRILAEGDGTLFYFDDSPTPAFTYSGVSSSPENETNIGVYLIGDGLQAASMSTDGSCFAAIAGSSGRAYSFKKTDRGEPYKLYELPDTVTPVNVVAMAPEGSYIIVGSYSPGQVCIFPV
jgi:WD40 repeat protein